LPEKVKAKRHRVRQIDPTPTGAPSADPTVITAHADVVSTPTSCVLPASVAAQADFYAQSGFYVQTNSYDLRPEVMESYYYAYRITGDPKYQEWAWDAFLAINSTARVGSGFSGFNGVNSDSVDYTDNQESFFFAELMKYAYLIFAEDGPWQVNGGGNGVNEFVYNTEAHPLRTRNTAGLRK
jgi:mannosyl-oligosaccharide alpha-1,2-mannosidase